MAICFGILGCYLGVAMVVKVLEKTNLECAQDCTGFALFAPDMQDCMNRILLCYPTSRMLSDQSHAIRALTGRTVRRLLGACYWYITWSTLPPRCKL
jgi:hypothetical protein